MAINWVDRVPTRANRVLVTPEDGSTPYYATITRADEPSVVGTPVNAANLNAMQNAAGLMASKYIYVATTGSDTTGTGSQAAPYATINKALSTIPKNLNGYEASIYISPGTYPENVLIRGFTSGVLRLTAATGTVAVISNLEVVLNTFVEITNLEITVETGYINVVGSNLRIFPPITATGGQYGLHAGFFSNVMVADTLTVNNTTNYSVVSTTCSNVFVYKLAGSGNNVTFRSLLGSTLSYGVNTSTATYTAVSTDTGGRVFSGAQTEPPRY